MVTPTSRPERAEHVLGQRAADTTVLLDPRSGEYFSLDEVGCRAWELSDGSSSVAEIAQRLAEEYDAPAAAIEGDLLDLFGELASAALVRFRD